MCEGCKGSPDVNLTIGQWYWVFIPGFFFLLFTFFLFTLHSELDELYEPEHAAFTPFLLLYSFLFIFLLILTGRCSILCVFVCLTLKNNT